MAAATSSMGHYTKAPTDGYDAGDGNNLRYAYVSDTDDLDELNDILQAIPLAKGTVPIRAGIELGDFDTNATPLCTHSLELYNGTTSYEVIIDSTIGQGGGDTYTGEGASDVLTPFGIEITASGAMLRLKTTAAPATAATSARKVVVWVLLAAVRPA